MYRTLITTGAMFAFVSAASAETILSYNLQGAPGNQASQTPDIEATHTLGADLVRGAGVTASNAGNAFSSAGWESAVAAPTSDEYFEFGFDVDPGYSVDLDSLFIGTRSSNTGPGTIGLFSSLDSFASPIATWDPDTTYANTIVALNTLADVDSGIRFRLYEIGNTAQNGSPTAGTGTFRITGYFVDGVFDRDVQITGSVYAVPEASSVVLGSVALLVGVSMVRIRRRQVNA